MTLTKEKTSRSFTIFSWNINNPSFQRVQKQLSWLRKQQFDVLVLTECKGSEGCAFIERSFQGYGLDSFFHGRKYQVIFPKPLDNEYGVLVASPHQLAPSPFSKRIDYLRTRVNSVNVSYFDESIEVIGVYVPSRGGDIGKRLEKKKRFIDSFLQALKATPISPRRILVGDFNVLEPNHVPHYPVFEDWEYGFYGAMDKFRLKDAYRHLHPTAQEHSWIGRTGNGYRYDHCFLSSDLIPFIDSCYYIHEPRHLNLSDHSAQVIVLKF